MAEDEENRIKASPLTLVEGEEVKRIRKRRIEEQHREPILVTDQPEGESNNVESGGFEDPSEQPMLSPIEEKTSPPLRTKSKGKRRATSEESSNHELLILLKEIRDEIRGRDE